MAASEQRDGEAPPIRWGRVLALAALVLAAANGALSLGLRYERALRAELAPQTAVRAKYGDALDAAYADYSPGELAQLLAESWERPPAPHYVNLFREAPIEGDYVRVDAAGFRRVEDQAPWPPPAEVLPVFVFGGSASFGYGVPDAETLPSLLQRRLRAELGERVAVYNFSRAFYFSSLELLLLVDLIERGVTPHLAVFIDGYNDCHSAAVRQPEDWPGAVDAEALQASPGGVLRAEVGATAIAQASLRVLKKAAGILPSIAAAPAAPAESPVDPAAAVENAVGRYERNHRMISAIGDALGFQSLFVLQPIPGYRQDTRSHPFFGSGLEHADVFYSTYARLEERIESGALGPDEISCAGVQEGVDEVLYVDLVHYNERMSERIVDCIVRQAPLSAR